MTQTTTSGAIGTGSAAPLSHRIAKINQLKWLLLAIPMIYIGATLGISLVNFLQRGFQVDGAFALDNFVKIFTEDLYTSVLLNTLKVGAIVTCTTLVLAYPIAYLSIRAKSSRARAIITGAVLIPYWISMLVRIFAWQILLQTNGLVNQLLVGLGIVDEPIQILYTTTAVVISLTHILLPYMFLSLQSCMENIDTNLADAAQIMGARPWRAFLDTFFPLSRTGMLSGGLMVFVLSLGFYIAPALLGGTSDKMVSNLIESNMNNFNWELASALSLSLIVIVFVLIGITFRFVGNIFVQKRG